MNAAAIVPGPDGVRLPNGTRVVHTRHASQGGRAYLKEMQEQVLEYDLHGGMAINLFQLIYSDHDKY